MTSGAVLITGCSTGIGRATAERLAKRGRIVYAPARRLESIADLEANGYEGMMGRMAAGPDAVARAIEHAVTSRHPRTRYRVTAGARVVLTSRKLLPDRAYDLMMRTQFPQPKA